MDDPLEACPKNRERSKEGPARVEALSTPLGSNLSINKGKAFEIFLNAHSGDSTTVIF